VTLIPLQEAKKQVVSITREWAEKMLPGWDIHIKFALKGYAKRKQSRHVLLTSGAIYAFIPKSSIKFGKPYKAVDIVFNQDLVSSNVYNIKSKAFRDLIVHELAHVKDVYLAQRKHKEMEYVRRGIMAKKDVVRFERIEDPHYLERYREEVKKYTGSVVPSLPSVHESDITPMAYYGDPERMAPPIMRHLYLYRCKKCGHIGFWMPELQLPTRHKRTKSGGQTMSKAVFGEGTRCMSCGKYMTKDTPHTRLTPREIMALDPFRDAKQTWPEFLRKHPRILRVL
jgi:hypothetical protein